MLLLFNCLSLFFSLVEPSSPLARSFPLWSIRGGGSPPPIEPIILKSPSSTSSCTIDPFGACVTSYVHKSKQLLATRSDSVTDGSKPIAGGIPFCWPQFGPASDLEKELTLQQHGFARHLSWTVESRSISAVTFSLKPSAYTREMWPNSFLALYTVSITDDECNCLLVIKNTNTDKPFHHQCALHTYFQVSDISEVEIFGDFRGKSYIDKCDDNKVKKEARQVITIPEFTDAVYKGAHKNPITVASKLGKIAIVPAAGFSDVVVWNPYGNRDMEFVTNWRELVCVESAVIDPVKLEPGEEWIGEFSLRPLG